jgi:hypothetical protein
VAATIWEVEAWEGALTIDEEDVRASLPVLLDPRLPHQFSGLRRHHDGRTVPVGRFTARADEVDRVLRGLVDLAARGPFGLYVSCNPLLRGLDAATAAKVPDFAARRWLLVDVDSVRPPDSNATDEERSAAWRVGCSADDDLREWGFPAPAITDTGNGYHFLYYLANLANDATTRLLLRTVLRWLASRHSDALAKIDPDNYAATKSTRVPGTWSAKGPAVPGRPRRRVRSMGFPEVLEAVPPEVLLAIAREAEGKPAAWSLPLAFGSSTSTPDPTPDPVPAARPVSPPARSAWEVATPPAGGSLANYFARAVEEEASWCAAAANGSRRNTLRDAAYKLAGLVPHGLDPETIRSRLSRAARATGLEEGEIDATLRDAIRDGAASPRSRPEGTREDPLRGPVGASLSAAASRPAPAAGREGDPVASAGGDVPTPLVVRASSVAPRAVRWLWPGRVALRKVTTFAGRTSIGKTFTLCDLAARVSVGGEIPCGQGECFDVGSVLVVSAEDDPDDTLVPRLIAAGADLDRIGFLAAEISDAWVLNAVATLERATVEVGPDVRLVVIDPPTSYLGSAKENSNAEIRAVVGPLRSWAATRDVAVVLNTHISKGSGRDADAASRVMGSVAWVNLVRAAFLFDFDPDDPTHDRRLFAGIKSNLAKLPPTLAYRIADDPDGARIEWIGEVATSADDAIAGNRPGRPRKADDERAEVLAVPVLVDLFRERASWPSKELEAAAKSRGVGRDAYWRARKRLEEAGHRIRAEQTGDGWVSSVPPDWPPFSGDDDDGDDDLAAF